MSKDTPFYDCDYNMKNIEELAKLERMMLIYEMSGETLRCHCGRTILPCTYKDFDERLYFLRKKCRQIFFIREIGICRECVLWPDRLDEKFNLEILGIKPSR